MNYDDATFLLYSDAKLLADLAEDALERVKNGNPERAAEILTEAEKRYGDMVGLRVRLQDAIRSLSSTHESQAR